MTSQPTIHTLALWRTSRIYRKNPRYFPKQLSSLCLWKWVEFRLESQWKMTYWELPKLGNKFSPNLILSWHKNYFHFLGNYSTLKCRSLFCQRWKGLRIDTTNSSTQIMISINFFFLQTNVMVPMQTFESSRLRKETQFWKYGHEFTKLVRLNVRSWPVII